MVVASVSSWVETAFHGELPRTDLIDCYSLALKFIISSTWLLLLLYIMIVPLFYFCIWNGERDGVCVSLMGIPNSWRFKSGGEDYCPWRRCHWNFWRSMASVEEFHDLFCSCLFVYIKPNVLTLFCNLIWIVILLKFPIL